MLLADTDTGTVVLGIGTAVMALIGTIFTGYMAYLMAKLKTGQDSAAIKVEELSQKTDISDKVMADKVKNVAIALVKSNKDTLSKVQEVSEKVDDNTKITTDGNNKLDTVHSLVNGKMLAALALIKDLATWKAEQTKTEEDKALADLALKNFLDCAKNQNKVSYE